MLSNDGPEVIYRCSPSQIRLDDGCHNLDWIWVQLINKCQDIHGDVCEEEKEVIEHGSVILLTEAISNVLFRKECIHGDVPLRVVGLRLVIFIRGEEFAREAGVGKHFRYDVEEVAVEVAPLSMARIETGEAEFRRQGGDIFWPDDEFKLGAEVRRMGGVRGARRRG
jgi:hypothetical protein